MGCVSKGRFEHRDIIDVDGDSICYCDLSSKDTLLKHVNINYYKNKLDTRNQIPDVNSLIDDW